MEEKLISAYRAFLDNGKTERECIRQIISKAEACGFRDISTAGRAKAGDRLYYLQDGKSIALFIVGSGKAEDGMNILGAHIDSPRLDIKMKPLYESDGIVYLDTVYYGGIKKYQWVTLPLALHGIVVKKDGSVIDVEIGEDDENTLCISDLLPHIAQEQMKKTASEFITGEDLDIMVGLGSCDTEEKDAAKNAIISVLRERYGIEEDDFFSAELEAVPAGRSKGMGLDNSMILAYGQDDRVCAFASLSAFLEAEPQERTLCCILVDKEEIGSCGNTGMDSTFFENAAAELLDKMEDYDGLRLRRMMRHSYMLSSDVNSAFDPLNQALFDKKNSSFLGRGVVFNRYTGGRGKSGASEANAEFIAKLRKAMDDGKVRYQAAEMSKVDVGGGGTIAKYSAYYGMEVIDCGVSVMSMHAPWEITAAADVISAYRCYKAFLSI